MRMPKTVIQALYRHMEEHPDIAQEEVMRFLAPYMKIDVERLKEQHIKRRVNYYMAKKRDSKGHREILAAKMALGTVYVLLEKSNNLEALKIIKSNLDKQEAGIRRTKRRAKKRIKQVEGQLSMDELQGADISNDV